MLLLVLVLVLVPVSQAAEPGRMEAFGMGPELFGERAKAWVEAVALVFEVFIAKIGVLVLAALAVRKTILNNREVKERLDRQGDRIDQVALAVPPAMTSTVKIEQPADEPIPVTETPPQP